MKAYDKGFPAKTHRDRGLGGLGASGAPDVNIYINKLSKTSSLGINAIISAGTTKLQISLVGIIILYRFLQAKKGGFFRF